MTVCLVDTTILLNVLGVPGRADQREAVLTKLAELIERGIELLLPFAAIIETGNHVARIGDGRLRRHCAEVFVVQVRKAIAGDSPWTVTPLPDPAEVLGWLDQCVDMAMRETGFADLSIIAEWEKQCRQWPERHILIWSLDHHLTSYDHRP